MGDGAGFDSPDVPEPRPSDEARGGNAFTRWRDRTIARPEFRAWAARFPLTRPIVRRRTRALFDLCAGFVYSQVLAACVQLDLFDRLANGPKSPAALAREAGMPVEGMERLLAAAASLKLLTRRGNGYGLGPLGAAMVGNAGITEMVRHHSILYADLADPVALLRGDRDGALGRYWDYTGSDSAAYTALMAASQPLVAGEILRAYKLGRHRTLLDVGGGNGAFLRAALAATPGLRGMLFDRPSVVAGAVGLDAYGGDFTRDPLPPGADVISLVRIIHDHDDPAAIAILTAVRRALPPGGTLLLAEPMADTPGAEPIGDAYFGFYLLAMGRGRPRSPSVLTEMLHAAGFARVRQVRTDTPLLISVLIAVNGD